MQGIRLQVMPEQIARDLRAAGVEADLLDSAALAKLEQFSASRYAALVLPYGSTYPQDSFANLYRFHRNGGSLITTGIPFAHPVARAAARDWNATPGWGPFVQWVPEGGPRPGVNAIRLRTGRAETAAVSSTRFAVDPGDAVSAIAGVRAVLPPIPFQTGASATDTVAIRFFDAEGNLLQQEATSLDLDDIAWHGFRLRANAPTATASADICVQVQRPGQEYLVASMAAGINNQWVALPNIDLALSGDALVDLGQSSSAALWEKNGIGIGGFGGPATTGHPASLTIAPGDPFHLSGFVTPTTIPRPAAPWLSPASLPQGVRLVPALGEPMRPVAGLLLHTSDPFAGAVDAWTYLPQTIDGKNDEARQILARATVAALSRRGRLTPEQTALALRRLRTLPR